jgi:hypothetical protein
MTKVIELPYNEELAKAIWPSFKEKIEKKHGSTGAEGVRFESEALKHLLQDFSFNTILDHSKDVWGQLFGVDLTCFNKREDHITIDVKGGKTSLYYDFDEKYWYITLKHDFFDMDKKNSHIMQVGPKGDKYAIYSRKEMIEFLNRGPRLIDDRWGKRLMLKDFPDFVQHNIASW